MTRHHSLLLAIVAIPLIVRSQESPYMLERTRIVAIDPDAAWNNCLQFVKSSPAIVNAVDPESRLISFTLPLSPKEAKSLLLDTKDVDKQAHTQHAAVWVSKSGRGTRLFARVSPNTAGFFSHSNGQVEREILDAMEKGAPSKEKGPVSGAPRYLSGTPDANIKAAIEAASASSRVRLNTANVKLHVLTLSLMIPSAQLGKFVTGVSSPLYPGAAHFTLWFEASPPRTAVQIRTLVLEAGSLNPMPRPSNGLLESAILTAIEKRAAGSPDATIELGSPYQGKGGFWTSLFGFRAPHANGEPPSSLIRELPAPFDQAWTAALQVLTQSQLIVEADRKIGSLGFLAAHTSEIGAKYAVHRVHIQFDPNDSATRMTVSIAEAPETPNETQSELRTIAERIGTELFLEERLAWLTGERGQP